MKKVVLEIVVRDENDARQLAKEMENSYIAQQGVFTLTCGDIQELSEEDKEEVFSQIPEETLGIDDE
jgi:hypothetical protein